MGGNAILVKTTLSLFSGFSNNILNGAKFFSEDVMFYIGNALKVNTNG
jgi:hypothetical protein